MLIIAKKWKVDHKNVIHIHSKSKQLHFDMA